MRPSTPAVLRVPVALEVRDQRRAEVAIGLLARIHCAVTAEIVERLLRHPKGAPVADRAHGAGAGQAGHDALDRGVHLAGGRDLVADQPALGAVALEPAL